MTTSRLGVRCNASRLGSLSLLAIAVAASLPAGAQVAGEAEEIIVTGSRVSRSGFDSSQPLTTIDSQQIENLGLTNVGDVIRTLPQNTPFFTETNVGIGNFNVGAQLANLRGLNPFFGTRTLTLVDTRARGTDHRGRRRRPHADPVDARGADRGRDGRRVGAVRLRRHRGRRQRDPRQGSRRLQGAGRLRPDRPKATAATLTPRSHGARLSPTTAAATCSRASSIKSRTASGPARTRATGAPKGGASSTTPRVRRDRNGLPNFVDRAGREANDVAVRPHHAVHERRVRRPAPPLTFNAGGTAVSPFNLGTPAQGFGDAHRRRRHAARVRHVERPARGRALLGDGARELRLQRPAQLVWRSRLLDAATRWARRPTAASVRPPCRSERTMRFSRRPSERRSLPTAETERAFGAHFHAGRHQCAQHDRERDDALRDRSRGRARQRVDVGRLLPARQEREPSKAVQQHGRQPRDPGRETARLPAVGARRRASNPANREPDRLPRDDPRRSDASARTRPAACR